MPVVIVGIRVGATLSGISRSYEVSDMAGTRESYVGAAQLSEGGGPEQAALDPVTVHRLCELGGVVRTLVEIDAE